VLNLVRLVRLTWGPRSVGGVPGKGPKGPASAGEAQINGSRAEACGGDRKNHVRHPPLLLPNAQGLGDA
jgi:hypothetical protein